MKNYLLLFTLGPVQSFIDQARKTLDLHAGSMLLSTLTWNTIQLAKGKYSAKIIFPFVPENIPLTQPSETQATEEEPQSEIEDILQDEVGKEPKKSIPDSMPNRFLAEVLLVDDQAAQAMGAALEQEIKDTLQSVAKKALKEMRVTDQAFRERFMQQLESQFEIYWVFEPVNDPSNDQNYRAAYAAVDKNMSIIKRVRSFKQLASAEQGRKCSVTGERNALVFSRRTNLPAYADPQAILIQEHPAKLSEREGLSAIIATKRFGVTNRGFSSTASIAALAFEAAALGSKLNFQLQNYRHSFGNADWDAQLYFPENLTQRYFEAHLSEHTTLGIPDLQKMLKNLRDKAKAENLPNIQSYYALLSFDGDRMGKIWSGSTEYLAEDTDLKTFQVTLAELLFNFAQLATQYLNKDRGQTVYAGGDDFIGFINLHHLFEVLGHLRALFRVEVYHKLIAKFEDKLYEEITFSAGICVAHYKTPLGEVVRQAKQAQKTAKEEGGRNAFAFYVMKRSGEVQSATIRWGNDADFLKNLDSLRTCVALLQHSCFSNTFITSLQREFLSLLGRSTAIRQNVDNMLELEIKRLINRSKIDQGIKAYQQLYPNESADTLLNNLENAVLTLFRRGGGSKNISNFLQMLEIADFLNRQPDHAN